MSFVVLGMVPQRNEEADRNDPYFPLVWEDEVTVQTQGPMTGVGCPTREAAQGFADELNAVVAKYTSPPPSKPKPKPRAAK